MESRVFILSTSSVLNIWQSLLNHSPLWHFLVSLSSPSNSTRSDPPTLITLASRAFSRALVAAPSTATVKLIESFDNRCLKRELNSLHFSSASDPTRRGFCRSSWKTWAIVDTLGSIDRRLSLGWSVVSPTHLFAVQCGLLNEWIWRVTGKWPVGIDCCRVSECLSVVVIFLLLNTCFNSHTQKLLIEEGEEEEWR